MPEPQKNSRRKDRFPIRLRDDDVVHKREQSIRVILNFDVHVKLDMLVFWLNVNKHKTTKDPSIRSSANLTQNGPSSIVQLSS